MSIFSLSEITGKAQSAFKRFPITLIWAILGTITCIVLVNDTTGKLLEQNANLILTLILGISWLIATRFYIEQTGNSKWNLLKLVVLLLLGGFYCYLPSGSQLEQDPEYILRFFLLLIAGHLFVFFAPFLFQWNKEAYWNYLKSTGLSIIRSCFFSGVLFLGLVLALLAIDALFEIDIPGERFGQLFIFCAGTVNTWIYLSDFPKNIQQHISIDFNKAIEVFVKYILIPLVILYLIILYAYSFKILIEWELPKGWVSYLVTALAFLGFVVQVIINPIQKTMKALIIRVFHPFFYILLLPLLVLLFTAIFRRIGDYGITENRYFVLLLAFWILAMTIYLLIAKKRRLQILPISLFCLVILSAFGYWGAISVSMRSQTSQFAKVFKQVSANANIATRKQHDQLKSILSYMNDRNSLSNLDLITKIDMQTKLGDTTTSKYNWFNASDAIDSLGITLSDDELTPLNENGKSYSYYNNDYNVTETHDITAFDYFMPIQLNQYADAPLKMNSLLVQFDKSQNILRFKNGSDANMLIEFSLENRLRVLTKFNSRIPNGSLDELVLDFENDKILGKLIFAELAYRIKNDTIILNHSKGFLFIKRK